MYKKYTTRRFQNVAFYVTLKTMFSHFVLINQFFESVQVENIFLDEYESINVWCNQKKNEVYTGHFQNMSKLSNSRILENIAIISQFFFNLMYLTAI